MASKQTIREHMLVLRRKLEPDSVVKAAQEFSEKFTQTSLFQKSQYIGLYLPINNEPDPSLLLKISPKKHWFLPVLLSSGQAAGQMTFCSYRPGDPLIKNQYGIFEPDPQSSKICLPENLDLVLVPLLAFDSQYNRLGMGGGYYDRAFDFLKNPRKKNHSKPYLLGLAYSFQYQAKLPVESWDIPIDDVWVLEVGLKTPGDTT